MAGKEEMAAQIFESRVNCAQAVLGAFGEDYGLAPEMALRVACGFAAGIRSANVCGAACGGVMVVGLKHGLDKETCNSETDAFLQAFAQRAGGGSILCREILGCDVMTPEGRADAMARNAFGTTCLGAVKTAVEILEDSGY